QGRGSPSSRCDDCRLQRLARTLPPPAPRRLETSRPAPRLLLIPPSAVPPPLHGPGEVYGRPYPPDEGTEKLPCRPSLLVCWPCSNQALPVVWGGGGDLH